MSEPVRILTVTKAQLHADRIYSELLDPHTLARMHPPKRLAVLDNPYAASDDDVVQLLGVCGSTVIGRLDILAGQVALADPSSSGRTLNIPISWASDWTVPEEHRGKLVGVSLMLKLHALTPPGGALGAHGPSILAVPVFQRLKWADIPMPRLILLRNSRSVVRRYIGEGARGVLPRLAADAALAGHGALLAAYASLRTRALAVREATQMPASWDDLLALPPAPGLASCARSAAHINWQMRHRFFDEPDRVARARNTILLVEDRRGEPVGYVMTKTRFHPFATHRRLPDLLLGSIQDWMVLPGRERDADDMTLVLLGARSLARQGADAVELCVPASSAAGLKRLGFLQVGAFHAMFRPAPGSALSDPRFASENAWRLRPGDGDNFFI